MSLILKLSYAITIIAVIYFLIEKKDNVYLWLLLPLAIVGIIFIYVLMNSQKSYQNIKIKSVEKSDFDKEFHQFPFEMQAIKNLGFNFFDHFKYEFSLMKMTIIVFEQIPVNTYYVIYRYDNHKAASYFLTYFNDQSSLITSSFKQMVKVTTPNTRIQYFPELSNSELLSYHKEAITYIENKYKFKSFIYENPIDYRNNFMTREKEYYASLGRFPYFKIRNKMKNTDETKFQEKLQLQESG